MSFQWVLKFVKSGNLLGLEVESKDLVNLGKKNLFSIGSSWNDSEMEIHRHLPEMFDVFHDDSIDEIAVTSITLPSVDEQLVGLLLIHDQVLSANNCQVFVALAALEGDDFVGFSSFGWKKFDFEFTAFKIVIGIINLNFVDLGNEEFILTLDLKTLSTFIIFAGDRYLEVVLILSSVNDKRFLIGLVSDTVSNLGTKHHL